MKLLECSHADISILRDALLINPNGVEFIVTSITVSLTDLTPWLHIKELGAPDDGHDALPFDSSFKDWSIQLGNRLHG